MNGIRTLLASTAPCVVAAPPASQLDLFRKGFAACLEPKGYTVK